jgi:hypothetical protein
VKLGHFTAEALQEFAEMKGLDTGNQDFSEGVFDFKVCERPNGKRYGIPDQDECRPPNREAKGAPLSVLGLNVGAKQNYDTAKSQGEAKNVRRRFADILGGQYIKGKQLNEKIHLVEKLPLDDENQRKFYIKVHSKLLGEMANLAESQTKAMRTILNRVPNESKPIAQKIIDLEARKANHLRNMMGLNLFTNPAEKKKFFLNRGKFGKLYHELNDELYPTLNERLKNVPLS